MSKVAIIGAGVVGTAMGYLLRQSGYSIIGIASRTLKSANRAREFVGEGAASTDLSGTARKADIVFITTSDRAIEKVCRKIASEKGFRPGTVVFHTCGALSSNILKSARKNGAYVASLHPLQSLASVKEAVKRIPGSYFCIEGDSAALAVAKNIISALKGREMTLTKGKKTLYHAGACAASNFLVAAIGFGLELFEIAGIKRKDSLKALMPLIEGTVKNVGKLGIPSALTGPISRGDAGVIRNHLKAISKERKDLVNLYSELGRYTVKLGLEKGTIKKKEADAIVSLFNQFQKGIRI